MASESEKFAVWSELAAGEEASQYIPLIDLALRLGADPHSVMKAAIALKLKKRGTRGHVLWLKDTPWFSAVFAAAIEAKIKDQASNSTAGNHRHLGEQSCAG